MRSCVRHPNRSIEYVSEKQSPRWILVVGLNLRSTGHQDVAESEAEVVDMYRDGE
jgi:hypothetical protein